MSAGLRLEEDRFGHVALPTECYYGIQTARCLENLSFSNSRLAQYPEFIASLLMVKRACARSNADAGVIAKDIADSIDAACQDVGSGSHADNFPVDMLHGGGGIAFNVNINEVIANVANLSYGKEPGTYAPVNPKAHVNASQSTADVCHTAVRLTILVQAEPLLNNLLRMMQIFGRKHSEFSPIRTIARTCMQDAMSISLGSQFGAYNALIKRRISELTSSIDKLRQINLGGTVIGSGDGAPEAYRNCVVDVLSLLTGRKLTLREDLYDAAQHIDDLAAVSAQLRILAQSLLKIAMDFRLLSSGPEAGLSEIRLPQLQDGSSFFANKVNPVVPETLAQACMQTIGCDRVVQAALEHGEPNLNIFEGAAAKNVFDQMNMLTPAVHLFTEKCLNGLKANEERCESYAANSRYAQLESQRK